MSAPEIYLSQPAPVEVILRENQAPQIVPYVEGDAARAALEAQAGAEQAKVDAQAAADVAIGASNTATAKAGQANASADLAQDAKVDAEQAKVDAEAAAAIAVGASNTATTKAGEASSSAGAAAGSASTATTKAGEASASSVAAVNAKNAAEAARDIAQDLSDTIADIAAAGNIYRTKGALTAGASSIDEAGFALVLQDESLSNHPVIYQKVSGALEVAKDLNVIVDITSVTGLQTALDAKVNAAAISAFMLTVLDDTDAASARVTLGLGSAATASASSFATPTYVDNAIAALINAAPGALDTLKELATALGNDPNFATTVTNAIATKLNASAVSAFGLTLIDDVDAATARATLGLGSAATQAASTFAQASNGTITNPVVVGYVEMTPWGAAPGTAFSPDLSTGTGFYYQTSGHCTITLPTPVTGKSFTVTVEYGGAHTISWAGGARRWDDGAVPTPTSVSGKRDKFAFHCVDGSTWDSVLSMANY